MANAGLTVRGLREIQVLFAAAAHKTSDPVLVAALRVVAEPVRRDAETLAVSKIPTVTVPWSQMRTGVSRKLIYVAPKKKGVSGRGRAGNSRGRPKFADLMRERAMDPALKQNEQKIVQAAEHLLDQVALNFNR